MLSPANTPNTAHITLLRRKIRWGEEPDNPSLIHQWLSQENNDEQHLASSRETLRQRYESQFNLLLEAVVDELVPSHWRCICLDNIYRPLQFLKQISDNKQSEIQIQHLTRELVVQSHYVRHSLCF